MAGAVALDDVGQSALRAEFARAYGGHKIREPVQAQLVAHLTAMGEPLAELGLDVTKETLEEWTDIWQGTLEDAGLDGKRDAAVFIAWGRARCSVAERGATAMTANDTSLENNALGPAEKAVKILEGSGVALSEAVRAKLTREFAEAAAGDFKSQCCNAVTVFILYLGRMPTDDEIRWWNRDFRLGGGSSGGKIDITRHEGYVRMHSKTSEGDVLTLARAIKNETRFPVWVLNTMEALTKAGKTLACVQLTRVLLQADKNSVGVWNVKAAYLHGYFFEEYLGLGMPEVTAFNSALHAVAVGAGKAKAIALERVAPALSEAGSMGGYTSLPGSASQAGNTEVSSALTALKAMMEDALTPLREIKPAEQSEKAKAPRALLDSKGGCVFCGRSWCTLLKGGEMCRAGKRALTLSRESKAKGDDDEGSNKDS